MTATPEGAKKRSGQSQSGVLSGVLGSEMKKAS